jgi:hypothetical protein
MWLASLDVNDVVAATTRNFSLSANDRTDVGERIEKHLVYFENLMPCLWDGQIWPEVSNAVNTGFPRDGVQGRQSVWTL